MFKILVVEDDRELNRTVCSFLNQSGYEAIGCLNASDAYDALYDNTIDLIVSSTTSSNIEGSLMSHYQSAAGDNQLRLLWCVIIFIALVMAFVFCGRLSIRIQKVNRKRRRENLVSRID